MMTTRARAKGIEGFAVNRVKCLAGQVEVADEVSAMTVLFDDKENAHTKSCLVKAMKLYERQFVVEPSTAVYSFDTVMEVLALEYPYTEHVGRSALAWKELEKASITEICLDQVITGNVHSSEIIDHYKKLFPLSDDETTKRLRRHLQERARMKLARVTFLYGLLGYNDYYHTWVKTTRDRYTYQTIPWVPSYVYP